MKEGSTDCGDIFGIIISVVCGHERNQIGSRFLWRWSLEFCLMKFGIDNIFWVSAIEEPGFKFLKSPMLCSLIGAENDDSLREVIRYILFDMIRVVAIKVQVFMTVRIFVIDARFYVSIRIKYNHNV